MFVVDSNVLIYAADFDSPFNARCRALVDDMRRQSGAWFLTWGIGYEFLRVMTHRRVLNAPWTSSDALRFLTVLVGSPAVSMLVPTERHPAVLAETLDVPRASVALIAGHGSRDKVVELDGIDPAEAERRLTAATEAA